MSFFMPSTSLPLVTTTWCATAASSAARSASRRRHPDLVPLVPEVACGSHAGVSGANDGDLHRVQVLQSAEKAILAGTGTGKPAIIGPRSTAWSLGTISQAIVGRVATGLGQAAAFTALPWVRRELLRGLGIDPCPGTLNLQVEPDSMAAWQGLTGQPGIRLEPGETSHCAARCYPVRLSGLERGPITAGVLVPEVAGYARDQVEVVAAVSLRRIPWCR